MVMNRVNVSQKAGSSVGRGLAVLLPKISICSGLQGTDSTTSTTTTCAGGTEVIGTLIDHLALGLQKWVGWRDGEECCLKGTDGIGGKCECPAGGAGGCCNSGSGSTTTCHQCVKCGTSANGPGQKFYLSAYCKTEALWITIVNGTPGSNGATVDTVKAAQDVHLLARIFLGSVCLIWSGLSQLGFLTGKDSDRWKDSKLNDIETGDNKGLGSFMAAMGYDLERLNQGQGKGGEFVQKLLSGQEPSDDKNKIKWQEFTKGANENSVADYYSSIYSSAKEAGKSTTESICKEYPLLVLHILASGYFRAGSAGANKVTVPPKAATSTTSTTPSPRKPRTIREILYWLSALPYSQGYRELVGRMKDKTEQVTQRNDDKKKGQIELYNEGASKGASTTLKRDCITHYLMAACGYCPLVLIGIQGTINTSGNDSDTPSAQGSGGGAAAKDNRCPEHSKDRSKRCKLADKKTQETSQRQQPQQQQQSNGKPLEKGQVCYGGYHLEVSQFGPLHGMYANGLYGFDLDGSSAQCLDQLRVYVYHCFYQLYFLRKQCGVGVESGAVLGWQSCRYGFQVAKKTDGLNGKWQCKPLDGVGVPGVGVPGVGVPGAVSPADKCNCLGQGASQGQDGSKDGSPLQSFLCDAPGQLVCRETIGKDLTGGKQNYPEIEDHMNAKSDFHPNGHLDNPHRHCPVPMGWDKEKHFKDLTQGSHKTDDLKPSPPGNQKYPAHCTGNTLSLLLEYYCDPVECPSGTLVVLLRLLACITPTVPRTLGDLFGFYYYIVYIGGQSGGQKEVYDKLKGLEGDVRLGMKGIGNNGDAVIEALKTYGGDCSGGSCKDTLKCLYGDGNKCTPFLSPLSGQQYGQLSPLMAGTYLSWLVYLIEGFQKGLGKLKDEFQGVDCKNSECKGQQGAAGCEGGGCRQGTHGEKCTGGSGGGVCKCTSVVSCTGVLPVLYKYGFGYGDVKALHKNPGAGNNNKKCHDFLGTLNKVLGGEHLKKDGAKGNLHHEINQLIYTTRLPWIFVLTLAWLVAVLYLAFGAIWPLDWTHMRSHWLRGGEHQWQCMWYKVMTGRKGVELMEYFGQSLEVILAMV